MIGKYSPQELITPEEAIALFEYGTIAEMYTVKALFDIYRQRHGVDADRLWDTMRVLAFVYDTGRIQGIREERAKSEERRGKKPGLLFNNLKVLDRAITFEYNRNRKGESYLYEIHFYRERSGSRPVADYIRELAGKNDKDSRIKLQKIQDYINALSEYGLQLREPYIKHLDGEIWELRPLRDRILFVAWHNGSFVLLHHFMKKTQKTPAREIDKAKRELADLIERGVDIE